MKLLLPIGLDGFIGTLARYNLGSLVFHHAVESSFLMRRGASCLALSQGALSVLRGFVVTWITFALMGGDHAT